MHKRASRDGDARPRGRDIAISPRRNSMNRSLSLRISVFGLAFATLAPVVSAQTPAAPAAQAPGGRGGGQAQAPQFVSPEVAADRKVTFRLFAPQATAV